VDFVDDGIGQRHRSLLDQLRGRANHGSLEAGQSADGFSSTPQRRVCGIFACTRGQVADQAGFEIGFRFHPGLSQRSGKASFPAAVPDLSVQSREGCFHPQELPTGTSCGMALNVASFAGHGNRSPSRTRHQVVCPPGNPPGASLTSPARNPA
jgi:hypothetical protein